jgi:hypothetical protein
MQSNDLITVLQNLALAGLSAKDLEEAVDIFKLIESCCRHGTDVTSEEERTKYRLDEKDL